MTTTEPGPSTAISSPLTSTEAPAARRAGRLLVGAFLAFVGAVAVMIGLLQDFNTAVEDAAGTRSVEINDLDARALAPIYRADYPLWRAAVLFAVIIAALCVFIVAVRAATRVRRWGGGAATVAVASASAMPFAWAGISAALARRLACEAGIIPAVLGGRSEVLDLGRSQRFHTKAQRIAAGLEQQHCNTEGCDWPPAMCHLHHPTPWSEGGGTNRDGMLLCPHHHTRAHDTNYQITTLPTGRVQFHPTHVRQQSPASSSPTLGVKTHGDALETNSQADVQPPSCVRPDPLRSAPGGSRPRNPSTRSVIGWSPGSAARVLNPGGR